MKFRTEIELRFSEMNNTAYADYAEEARVLFFRHLELDEKQLSLVRIAFDFKKLTHYLDQVYIHTTVEQLGRSSITLKHIIFSSGEVGALGNTVSVYVNHGTKEPQALSTEMRRKLEPYLE
ncbi:MAG: acyl-CoA thioesterase [Trueperaceae bacterium]|nr:acyl-CoA thioesterase [Trueperaceae bacterium]